MSYQYSPDAVIIEITIKETPLRLFAAYLIRVCALNDDKRRDCERRHRFASNIDYWTTPHVCESPELFEIALYQSMKR